MTTIPVFIKDGHFPSYLNPKCGVRSFLESQQGVFALEPIAKDETVIVWSGKIVHHNDLDKLEKTERDFVYQVDDQAYQVAFTAGLREPSDFVNHSCNPTCGLRGQIILAAMRDISPGEEINFDYAMCDTSSGTLDFPCQCGGKDCRKWVGQDDWKRPDLWERYAGYFAPHVQRGIDRIRSQAQ